VVTTDFTGGADQANGIALQPDGKIVVAGSLLAPAPTHVELARYNRDGTLDSSFGTGGKVSTEAARTGGPATANAVALQRDGKIVVAGQAPGSQNRPDFLLVRYLENGALDPDFGGGVVTTEFAARADRAYALAIQPDGKIIAAGENGAN